MKVTYLVVIAAAALSAGAQDNEQLIDGIICREAAKNNAATAQEWLDGALAAGAGQTSEWFVLALRQYRPELDFSAYAAALEARLGDGKISGAVARQRCALLLVACGRADSPAVSGRPNSRFIFCTACPAAPFTMLSSAPIKITRCVRSSMTKLTST